MSASDPCRLLPSLSLELRTGREVFSVIAKASSPFAALLEGGTLRRMAGAKSFERGEDYFLNGQVKALTEDGERLRQRCKAPNRIGSSCGLRTRIWITRVHARWGRKMSFASTAWPWD